MPANKLLPLFHGQNDSAWHEKTSEDISVLATSGCIPVLPVCSFCRRSDNAALDLEEQLLGTFLERIPEKKFITLPPFRYVPQQDPRQLFTLTPTVAWQMLSDVLICVSDSGFKQCVVFHGHPLLADWLDCGLRDHRLATGMGLFRISLESIGVDTEQPPSSGESLKESPLHKTALATFLDLLDEITEQPLPPPLKT